MAEFGLARVRQEALRMLTAHRDRPKHVEYVPLDVWNQVPPI
jgi:hypothetical protein